MGLGGRRQQGARARAARHGRLARALGFSSHPVLTDLSRGDAIADLRRRRRELLEAHSLCDRSLDRVAGGLPPGSPDRSPAWRRAIRRACGRHDLGVRGQHHRIPRLVRGIRGRRPARGRADRRGPGRAGTAARRPGERSAGSGCPRTRDSTMGRFAAGGRHRDGGQPTTPAPAATVREYAGCRHSASPVPGVDDRSRTGCARQASRAGPTDPGPAPHASSCGWSGRLTKGGADDAPDDS